MHSASGRAEWLRARARISSEVALLAMTEARRGDISAARRHLEELRSRVEGPWASKIDILLEGL